MDWIKRNLIFAIGGLVALLLLGGAGFYLFKSYSERSVSKQKLDESYGQLGQLTSMNPGPGDGKKVDNIHAAKQYQTNLVAFIGRSGRFFAPIAPIPDSTNVAAAEFAADLRNTIGKMQRAATNASVQLPADCDFSFKAIKPLITFHGGLQALSTQLGEVKAICDVLFKAKINSLENVRRERVSPDDTDMADYLEEHSITNEIAVLSPYEIVFRCFSTELAGVMSGFESSTHGFIVSSVTIASGEVATSGTPGGPASPVYTPVPAGLPPRRGADDPDMYFYDPVNQTVLDEQPLRVTLKLMLVKPIEQAK